MTQITGVNDKITGKNKLNFLLFVDKLFFYQKPDCK